MRELVSEVSTLGSGPAAVEVDQESGAFRFLVNPPAMMALPPEGRAFVVAHELGHLLLGTPSERLADSFALGMTQGTRKGSLKAAVETLDRIPGVTRRRVADILRLAVITDIRKNY